MEDIISGAALLADSSCTRDERRERIVGECNAVRQALQDRVATKIIEDLGEALFKEFIIGLEPVSTIHYIRTGTCIKHPLH